MIKAVIFDLHETLAHYDPPRHKLHATAARRIGIEVSPEAVLTALPTADNTWRQEVARLELNKRSKEEKYDLFATYEQTILQAAGKEVPRETAARVFTEFQKFSMSFVLYEDCLPTLKKLKGRGLILGMLSNITRDATKLCQELGLTPYLDFAITSQEVGAEKPHPAIFLAALERAGVKANQAMYVGDQYELDVVGARGVDINPVLINRNDIWPEATDCPHIHSLTQIEALL